MQTVGSNANSCSLLCRHSNLVQETRTLEVCNLVVFQAGLHEEIITLKAILLDKLIG